MLQFSYSPASRTSLVGCCGFGQADLPSKPTKGEPIWCETRGGMYMCLPNTLEQVGIFKGLQRAVNAFFERMGDPERIRVDARIGPETLAAVTAIANVLNNSEYPAPTSTEELSSSARRWADAIAGTVSVATNYDPDPKKSPVEIDTRIPADVEDTRKRNAMSEINQERHWAWYLVGGLLLAGVVYLGYRHYEQREEEEEYEEEY